MKNTSFDIADEYLRKDVCESVELPPRAWVHETVKDAQGNIRAVLIDSEPLDAQVWVIVDRKFDPKDDRAIFYPDEFSALKNKTPNELCQIHQVKLVFPGARVIQ